MDLPEGVSLMSSTTGHLIETVDGVSLAEAGVKAEGADVKSMPVSHNGLSSELLEELAALAAERTAEGRLRLMGEDGILPERPSRPSRASCGWTATPVIQRREMTRC
ncbi:hypothetical protein ACWD04_26640 [Streptomyces sp. NPDC002911]